LVWNVATQEQSTIGCGNQLYTETSPNRLRFNKSVLRCRSTNWWS
jgi:hypothetical protein